MTRAFLIGLAIWATLSGCDEPTVMTDNFGKKHYSHMMVNKKSGDSELEWEFEKDGSVYMNYTVWGGTTTRFGVRSWRGILTEDTDSQSLALPFHTKDDYWLIKTFIEKHYPKYEVVFVNDDEKLLNKGAIKSPIRSVPVTKAFKIRAMGIWLIQKQKESA